MMKIYLVFLTGLLLQSCDDYGDPVVSNIKELNVKTLNQDSLQCTYQFEFCDTCILLDEIIEWEKNRGSRPVKFDRNSFEISLNHRYSDHEYFGPRAYLSDYVAFFYQDTSSFIKEIAIYRYSDYLDSTTQTSLKRIWGFQKKYFFRSDYLVRHLMDNEFVLQGRRSINRSDTILIRNNISVKQNKKFDFEELETNFYCLRSNLEQKYNLELEVKNLEPREGVPDLGFFKYFRFDVPGSEKSHYTKNQEKFNSYPDLPKYKFLGSSVSEIPDSLRYFGDFWCNFTLSEINYFSEELGNMYDRENACIFIAVTMNQKNSALIKRKLNRLTKK